MAIKPILFNTEMVQAIIQNKKTQTRRLVKDKDIINSWDCESDGTPIAYIEQSTGDSYHPTAPCPYQPGDILWVRETFDDVAMGHPWYYRADGDLRPKCWQGERWLPSIHMPKEAARIFLCVKDVRVERLDNMGEEDAIAEGCEDPTAGTYPPLARFSVLWDTTIKREDLREYGVHANPWVWVITFERVAKPEGWCE